MTKVVKKAVVIGIDHYPTAPLKGCVNDANAVADALAKNGDGSPNFELKRYTSDKAEVTNRIILDALDALFKRDAGIALLYFSGHGIIDQQTNAGYIVSQNGERGAWGVSLADIANKANKAYPKIDATVIILDCCHSGYAGEVQGLGDDAGKISVLGNGVTILTASHREEVALAFDDHSLFTGLLLDGLNGAAADICGQITPASIYSHIDQTLGAFEQRPIYKANVQSFVTLRNVPAKIPLETLRKLPHYFPEPSHHYDLDPSYEPDLTAIPEEFWNVPDKKKNEAIFRDFQNCNRQGLVVPVDAEDMFFAAIHSKASKLTKLGVHYRRLAERGRF